MLSKINLYKIYMALKRKVPQGIIHPLSKCVYRPSFLADSSLTRLYFALLIPALRLRLRAVSIWLSSNRNGSAPKKRVIIISKGQSFVIHRYDSHSTWFLVSSLFFSASCSLSFIIRMTTCREPKVHLAGATFSQKVNYTLSKR